MIMYILTLHAIIVMLIIHTYYIRSEGGEQHNASVTVLRQCIT